MQNQTCIVTGANGFIGKSLCGFLNNKGHTVRACVRKSSQAGDFETGDLLHFTKWDELFKGAHTLVHLAAKVHDMSNPPASEYTLYNRDLTKKLAMEAKKAGLKRLVFISSIKVNGEFTGDKAFTPEDVSTTNDPYGLSKFEAEQELLKLHEKGRFEVVIIRPCLIYGPGVKANFNNLVKLVKKGLPLPFASVRNKRSLVSVDNLIDLIYLCLSHPAAAGEVFLVSDDKDLSLPQMIEEISQATHAKVLLLPFPQKLFDFILKAIGKKDFSERLFGNLQVDISKTKKLLGWKPPYTMQDTLRKMNL